MFLAWKENTPAVGLCSLGYYGCNAASLGVRDSPDVFLTLTTILGCSDTYNSRFMDVNLESSFGNSYQVFLITSKKNKNKNKKQTKSSFF